MADENILTMTELTSPVSADMIYAVDDPSGVPADRKLEIGTLLGNDGAWANLVKNSPGQIVTDGAEPQWWDDSANATGTDEDAAGEGIPDKTERIFKVVTTGDDHYTYQTFTFADESLLDAGVTTVSLSCWVYCADANKASIGLYGANLGLQESSQAGAAAWELLTVENITLDAADASIQVRLIVDTGTAYFTMPMLNVGSKALPWKPRGSMYNSLAAALQLDLNTTGDVAWSDTDCTANTDPLAWLIQARVRAYEPDGTAFSVVSVAHNDTILGSDQFVVQPTVWVVAESAYHTGLVICDDSQVIRYRVVEQDADSDMIAQIHLMGYWRWAP